jgi:gamma-glutamyltranspeptidase/glutathione hydrolase
VTGLNGSGRASRHATADWLKASGLSEIATDNIHAVTVPGAVDGWQALLDKHGSMSLGDVLQPAIKLARDGCPVGPRTAHDWAGLEEFIGQDEGGRMHYLPGGKAPVAGQVIAYPALAKRWRPLQIKAGTVSTRCRVAEDIVKTLQAKGSLLDMEDLAATQVVLGHAHLDGVPRQGNS